MSSTVDNPLSPFSIQNIITKLETLAKECVAKVDPPKQATDGTNTGVSQGNSVVTHKQDGDARRETNNTTESNNKGKDAEGKKKALHELEKLCKELDYMISSFKKLEEFEKSLKGPLKTLEDNVNDIVADLGKAELPKQVHNNLRVLRNNITRVKILIPVQQQTASISSEGSRALQTTVATGDAGDLPHLYSETSGGIFEESYYYKEVAGKYDNLNMREKLCLLCFAIFPENAEIKKRFLRFWWVGENLIPPQGGRDDKGMLNDTLDTFVKKKLIEPILKKNKLEPRSYKMTPIVRSCLIIFAKRARFFDYDQEGKPIMDFSSCNKACMVKSEGATAPWFAEYLKGTEKDKESEKPKEQQGQEPQEQQGGEKPKAQQGEEKAQGQQGEEKAQGQQGQGKPKEQQGQGKLSADLVKLQMLFNFPDKDTLIKASEQFGNLQTLFNLSKQFPALPKEWFAKMTGLQVLYLGKWETMAGRSRHIEVEDIDFLKALKNMKKLRLLSLQGISGIPKIPGTLGKLESLEILDLRACHNLEKLPDRIGSLKKLTYLDLSECYLLDYMPKRLSQLEKLQVLKGFVVVDTKDTCTLNDLSNLENLRKLSINVNTTTFNIDAQEKALSQFQKLEKLRIAWGSGGMPKEDSAQESKDKKQQVKSSTEKPRIGFKQAAKMALVTSRIKLPEREKKRENLKGLQILVKLDLQCYPHSAPPEWMVPSKMVNLTNLSIRGGRLSHLVHERVPWEVDILRLKFLVDFKMNWKEMQERFPNLKYLEKVRSPRITFCPCDANGVWQSSSK